MNAQCVNLSYWMDAVPDNTTYFQVIDNAGGTLSNNDLLGNDPCIDFTFFGCGAYIIEAIDTSRSCTNCEIRDTIYPYICCEIFVTFENDTVLCDGTLASSLAITTGGDGGPYSYNWSNGQTANPAVNLDSGFYELEVTDSIGCIDSFSTQIFKEEDCSPCDCGASLTKIDSCLLLVNIPAACDAIYESYFVQSIADPSLCGSIGGSIALNGAQDGDTIQVNDSLFYYIQGGDNDMICGDLPFSSATSSIYTISNCTDCPGCPKELACDCEVESEIVDCQVINWFLNGTDCANYDQCIIYRNGLIAKQENNFTSNVHSTSGLQISTGDQWTIELSDLAGGTFCEPILDTVDVTCTFVDCDCTPFITNGSGCVVSYGMTGTGCSNYNVFTLNGGGVPAPPNALSVSANGTYTFTIDGPNCSPRSASVDVTNCTTTDCTGCDTQTFNISGCELSWNDCPNGWTETLVLVGSGPITPSGPGSSHTATQDGTYLLTWSKTGCTSTTLQQIVTGCDPVDCSDCPNPNLSVNGCDLTWTNCPGWTTVLRLNGTPIPPSGGTNSHTAAVDGVYEVTWSKSGCADITDSENITGCSPTDCTGCSNPIVTVNNCDVTHTVCTNGWVANIFLQSNGALVDSDNDGMFTGQDGVDYIIRWTKTGCSTIVRQFTTNCPTLCNVTVNLVEANCLLSVQILGSCPNPTFTFISPTNVSTTNNTGVHTADEDGTWTVIVNGCPNCGPLTSTVNVTGCIPVVCDCAPNDPTTNDDCEVLYDECPGYTLDINGNNNQTGGVFQGQPNTLYTLIYSKAGCPNVTKTVATPSEQITIDLGNPVIDFQCISNSYFGVVTFPDLSIDCICCDNVSFDLRWTRSVNGGAPTISYISPIDCNTTEITAGTVTGYISSGFFCGGDTTGIFPMNHVISPVSISNISNPKNCDINIVQLGQNVIDFTIQYNDFETCCPSGNSEMIGEQTTPEEYNKAEKILEDNQRQQWPLIATISFIILIIFGVSSFYKPK